MFTAAPRVGGQHPEKPGSLKHRWLCTGWGACSLLVRQPRAVPSWALLGPHVLAWCLTQFLPKEALWDSKELPIKCLHAEWINFQITLNRPPSDRMHLAEPTRACSWKGTACSSTHSSWPGRHRHAPCLQTRGKPGRLQEQQPSRNGLLRAAGQGDCRAPGPGVPLLGRPVTQPCREQTGGPLSPWAGLFGHSLGGEGLGAERPWQWEPPFAWWP